jgi:signal transduction histidine kinase
VRRPVSVLVVAVVGLAVAGVVLTLGLAFVRPGAWATHEVVGHLYFQPVQLAFGLAGAAVLAARPWHPVGLLFAALGLLMGLAQVLTPWVVGGLPGTPAAARLLAGAGAAVLGILALALLLFPDGRPPSPRWRVPAVLVAVLVAVAATTGLVAGATAAEVFVVPSAAALLLAGASLVARWRGARDLERQQVRWLALAGVLFGLEVLLGLVTAAAGWDGTGPVDTYVGNALFALLLLSVPVAMGIALTRFGLYDVDRLLSRVLAYAGLAGLLGLVWVGAVTAVAGVLAGRPEVSLGLALALTVLVAVVFHPVRVRLVRTTERWVYGPRADRYALLRSLASDLTTTPRPDDVPARVAAAARTAVRARGAEVVADVPGGGRLRGVAGDLTPDRAPGHLVTSVPLVLGGEPRGEVRVVDAAQAPGEREALGRIADVAAPALQAAALLVELDGLAEQLEGQSVQLEQSRARLARAEEDERERWRRTVHGRLLPRIERVRTALDGSRSGDPAVGPPTEEVLARSAEESGVLAAEVRALAHDVMPPLLVDRGLVPALRSLARETGGAVQLDVVDWPDATRLPPEVESALYLACREQLPAVDDDVPTALRLSSTSGGVRLEVTRPAGPAGACSAVDRLAAVGGRLVRTVEGGRALLRADVPLTGPATG